MSSEKLKKYLAYYQKTLRDEPENIEARLRLASLFKEMGQKAHAIEEYVTASKLLAAQGLPLEAIAACKAVLELDPAHTEVQFFLAKLFAQAPDAAGARVARPVRTIKVIEEDTDPPTPPQENSKPIPLRRTKQPTPVPAGDATRVADSDLIQAQIGQQTVVQDSPVHHTPNTMPLTDNEATGMYDALPPEERSAIEAELYGPDESEDEVVFSNEFLDELRRTAEMEVHKRKASNFDFESLRETQAIDPDDILLSESLEEVTAPTTQAIFNTSKYTAVARRRRLEAPTKQDDPPEITASFELGVFELDDVLVDGVDDLIALDMLDSDVLTDHDEDDDDIPTGRLEPTTISIVRDELPDIPLFSHLSPMAFMELLRLTEVEDVQIGEHILQPGHGRRSLFIVVKGQVIVTKHIGDEDVCLATNSEGDFFGEFGLLTGRDHSATVTATQPTTLLVVNEDAIQRVAEHDAEIWDRLWDYYHIRMLNNLMSSHGIFGKLGAEDREDLIDSFELREFEEHARILSYDEPCHFVYLILFGEVMLKPYDEPDQQRVLREGEFFGFLPSLSDEPGKTEVLALKDTSLLCLPARDFRALTRKNARIAGELRNILKARAVSKDSQNLFLCGITHYADSGAF